MITKHSLQAKKYVSWITWLSSDTTVMFLSVPTGAHAVSVCAEMYTLESSQVALLSSVKLLTHTGPFASWSGRALKSSGATCTSTPILCSSSCRYNIAMVPYHMMGERQKFPMLLSPILKKTNSLHNSHICQLEQQSWEPQSHAIRHQVKNSSKHNTKRALQKSTKYMLRSCWDSIAVFRQLPTSYTRVRCPKDPSKSLCHL